MFFLKSWIDGLESSLVPDLLGFLPELVLCGTIVLLLLLRLFKAFARIHMGGIALVLTGIALMFSCGQWVMFSCGQWVQGASSWELFTGLLAYDYFTVFLRIFLLSFALLIIWLSLLTGIPDREDSA